MRWFGCAESHWFIHIVSSGPLNINLSYKFCQMLIAKLASPDHANKTIYFYCFNRPQNKANAAVLIGIYLVVYQGRTSAAAYEPLKALEPYMPFRDASQGICTFRLAVQHCLRAVAKAQKLKFFDFDNWNSAEYEHFESVENGGESQHKKILRLIVLVGEFLERWSERNSPACFGCVLRCIMMRRLKLTRRFLC